MYDNHVQLRQLTMFQTLNLNKRCFRGEYIKEHWLFLFLNHNANCLEYKKLRVFRGPAASKQLRPDAVKGSTDPPSPVPRLLDCLW